LTFTESEQQLLYSHPTISAQVYCALQIGYFKAKQMFFGFAWHEVKEDVVFIFNSYFSIQRIKKTPINKHEYYIQCVEIAKYYGYQHWSNKLVPIINQFLTLLINRDVSISFIVIELMAFFKKEKIIRPGYTTFQNLISQALSVERKRLIALIKQGLSDENKIQLQQLLIKDNTLSDLAALKQDAKNFKPNMMKTELKKFSKLKPFYVMAKGLLPVFGLSQQNIQYYASLANYYSIHELRETCLNGFVDLLFKINNKF